MWAARGDFLPNSTLWKGGAVGQSSCNRENNKHNLSQMIKVDVYRDKVMLIVCTLDRMCGLYLYGLLAQIL